LLYVVSPSQLSQGDVVGIVLMFAFFCVLLPTLFWCFHARRRRFFMSRRQVVWEFSATGGQDSWSIDGLLACEGWRSVTVTCKRLPKNRDRRSAFPELRVLIDSAPMVPRAHHLTERGDHRSVSRIDKAGEPLRILLTHTRPEVASEDEPWEVEIGVRGDPSPPKSLRATSLSTVGPE
ncbi:MAG: hypothetical protein AAFV77_07655, partial [Planctomycetota bacterium]